ncbi:MAG: hypothetical protein SGBAC_008382, partial [Bacillariaceae sp.]
MKVLCLSIFVALTAQVAAVDPEKMPPAVADRFDYAAPWPSNGVRCALLNVVVDETHATDREAEWLKDTAIPGIATKLYSDEKPEYNYDHVFVCGNGFGKEGAGPARTYYRWFGCTRASTAGVLADSSVTGWETTAANPEDGWMAMTKAMENLPRVIETVDLQTTCDKFDRALILSTDQGRDAVDSSLTLAGTKALIKSNGYILNAIVRTWIYEEVDERLSRFAAQVADGGDEITIVTRDGSGYTEEVVNENYDDVFSSIQDIKFDYIPLLIDEPGWLWNTYSIRRALAEGDEAWRQRLVTAFTDHFIMTKADELATSHLNGDPHVSTWKNEHFEYHGQCDLVMLKDPEFADGLGLEVHVRTKIVRFWSYIKNVAIRIGNDVLEVEGSADPSDDQAHYWMNYEYEGELDTFAGFPVTQSLPSVYKRQYKIDLSSKYKDHHIIIQIYKEFVNVQFVGGEAAYGKTVGLLGDFRTGKTLARDGSTVMHDFTEFGDEWQVLPSEAKLFREASDPQFPELCIKPEDPRGDRRRRLAESNISIEQAEIACSTLKDALSIKDCVYDILATQDLDMV